jgi:nucleoside-diphosphate-sugar epimerase
MKTREMKRILVTGAVGQIGSELTLALRKKYGADNVVATGRKTPPSDALKNSGPFYFIDVNKRDSVVEVVKKHDVDTIYHMAAILSVAGEQNPQLAWRVNMDGLYTVLEVAREFNMARVIVPSSIAAFGPDAQRHDSQAQDNLRRDQGRRRAARRLLLPEVRPRLSRAALSGHHLARDSARRRHH